MTESTPTTTVDTTPAHLPMGRWTGSRSTGTGPTAPCAWLQAYREGNTGG
jgi:hypothetical protein